MRWETRDQEDTGLDPVFSGSLLQTLVWSLMASDEFLGKQPTLCSWFGKQTSFTFCGLALTQGDVTELGLNLVAVHLVPTSGRRKGSFGYHCFYLQGQIGFTPSHSLKASEFQTEFLWPKQGRVCQALGLTPRLWEIPAPPQVPLAPWSQSPGVLAQVFLIEWWGECLHFALFFPLPHSPVKCWFICLGVFPLNTWISY